MERLKRCVKSSQNFEMDVQELDEVTVNECQHPRHKNRFRIKDCHYF